MSRLPIPGQDVGTWGNVLNDYLSVAHNPDGTLVTSGANDATASAKGIVQLVGDLAGTANNPQVTTTHLSSALPVNQGGTGAATQNFVDLTTNQTVAGAKTLTSTLNVPGGTVVPSDWVNVKVYGAKGDNSTDDLTAIQNAINATPAGGITYFPAGFYIVSNTITIPANVTLRGSSTTRWPQYGGIPTYLKPKFGAFNGTALLSATEVDGWRIESMNLSSGRATGPGGVAVDALYVVGAVKGVRIRDLLINNFSGYGIHTDTTANGCSAGWEVANVNMYACLAGGWRSDNTAAVSFGFSDSVIESSEVGASGGTGWYWNGLAAVDFVGLRSTWNTGGYGFAVVGSASNVGFTECQTDRSMMDGWYLNCVDGVGAGAPAPHVILLNGCHASRDGKNNNAGQGGYAGVRIVGASTSNPHIPVVISGFQSHVSKDDNGGGQLSPDYGIYVTNGRPGSVIISGGIVQGTVAPTFDDNNAIVDAGAQYNLIDFTSGAVTYNATPPKSNRNMLNGSILQVNEATTPATISYAEIVHFQRSTDHTTVLVRNNTVGGNTNPTFVIEGNTTSSPNFSSRVIGDVNNRFLNRASGILEWGDGTLSRDITIARTAVGTLSLGISGAATTAILDVPGSVQIGKNTVDLGGGVGVVGLANATTAPTTNPSNGGILYAASGEPMWRDSSGQVYNLTTGTSPSVPLPSDYNYIAWSYDPVSATGSTSPTSGVLYLQRIDIRTAQTVTKVLYGIVSTTGMSLTAGQNFVGIYNSAGTLVGSSADISASVVSGENAFSLSSSASLTQGMYWIGLLMVGSTMPTVARGTGQMSNVGSSQLTAATRRFGSYGTSQTALPSTITPSSISSVITNTYWAATA